MWSSCAAGCLLKHLIGSWPLVAITRCTQRSWSAQAALTISALQSGVNQ